MSVPLVLRADVLVNESGSEDGFSLDNSARFFDLNGKAKPVGSHFHEILVRVEERRLVSEAFHFNSGDQYGQSLVKSTLPINGRIGVP